MPPIQSKLKGKILHSHSYELVINIYNFMKREASIGTVIHHKAIQKRVTEAIDISERFVS
jgi:6-pyruvoyl-tetrahydropterin synthase